MSRPWPPVALDRGGLAVRSPASEHPESHCTNVLGRSPLHGRSIRLAAMAAMAAVIALTAGCAAGSFGARGFQVMKAAGSHEVPAPADGRIAVGPGPSAYSVQPQTPGVDVLAGVPVVPVRVRHGDYRRAAFGEAWTDDTDAPGGHNQCDTRNDILDRDLVDKTYVATSRCPRAVAKGVLHDPYTSTTVNFQRGNKTGAAIQIDHIVPLAYSWDQGAWAWPEPLRVRFANDPANLVAVQGQANQLKGDKEPASWMPPNAAFHCQYAMQFIAVMRAYGLAVDGPSVPVLRDAAATCPAGR